MTPTPAPRRGARLGGWALALSFLGPVWLGLTGVLIAAAFGGPDVVGWIATAVFFIGFVVVPGSGLLALTLGIIALVVNRPAGKVMGALAVVLVALAVAVLVWAVTTGIAAGFSLV